LLKKKCPLQRDAAAQIDGGLDRGNVQIRITLPTCTTRCAARTPVQATAQEIFAIHFRLEFSMFIPLVKSLCSILCAPE
jgi:hypothetical protein